MARATWFCVDIECSGPVPALYDMISLGCVPVWKDSDEWQIGEGLYLEFRPEAPGVDPGAMAVNGLDLERLRREGLPMADGLRTLSEFVAGALRPKSKPVFVGHNAPFDWSFVSYAYQAADQVNPFGYKALDTKALSMGILGLHWFDSNKEELDKRLQLPPVARDRVHRADYDAWYQAHILVQLLQRMPGIS